MVISEFAGAAQSLNGSIVVNPWDSQQVADAIHEAVTLDAATRKENHKKLYKVRKGEEPPLNQYTYCVFLVCRKVLCNVLGKYICWRTWTTKSWPRASSTRLVYT